MSICQVFSFRDDLNEVVPNGLYMQAVVGETMSVGVVNFVQEKGADIAAKSHAHGEEATLQITGGCAVYVGDQVADMNDPQVQLEAGRLMVMPAEQPHYGVNRFDEAGQCLRLNVVTPPRQEYGSKGAAKVYYPGAENK